MTRWPRWAATLTEYWESNTFCAKPPGMGVIELRQEPELTALDDAEIANAVDDVAGDDLRTLVEYDEQAYNLLYIRDDVVGELGGAEAFTDLADELHADYRLDFTQQELYEEIYGELGNVRAFVAVMDHATILRVIGSDAGLYVSLEPAASIQAVLDAVHGVVDGE